MDNDIITSHIKLSSNSNQESSQLDKNNEKTDFEAELDQEINEFINKILDTSGRNNSNTFYLNKISHSYNNSMYALIFETSKDYIHLIHTKKLSNKT